MKNLITLTLATLTISSAALAMSPVRPQRTLDCSAAEEVTYVLNNPFESIQVKMGENPSTGYAWYGPAKLEERYVSDCGKNPVPGCGGTKYIEIDDDSIAARRNHPTGKSTFRFELKSPGDRRTVQTCTVIIKTKR